MLQEKYMDDDNSNNSALTRFTYAVETGCGCNCCNKSLRSLLRPSRTEAATSVIYSESLFFHVILILLTMLILSVFSIVPSIFPSFATNKYGK